MSRPANGLRRVLAFGGIVLGSFAIGVAVSAAAGGLAAVVGDRLEDLSKGRSPTPSGALLEWRDVPDFLHAWTGSMRALVEELAPSGFTGIAALAIAVVVSAAPALLSAPALAHWDGEPCRRSLRASVAGASILGGACALGILMTAWDAGTLLLDAVGLVDLSGASRGTVLLGDNGIFLFPAWLVAGLVWAWLIARAGAAQRPDRIDRAVRWIFHGTCLELAIAAPTYVFAMRRDTCWCSWGSWLAITAGTTALALLCGPAILLMATRESRLRWVRGVCADCGYPRRGGEARCPECGQDHAGPGATAPVAGTQ
jgi:hypothetical protein